MNGKNTCSYTDRNPNFNALANSLYPPKKELFDNLCQTTTNKEIKKICCNSLINDYSNFAECENGGFFVTKENDYSNLYVLDKNKNEIDKISLNVPSNKYIKEIVGIAYDSDLAKIYIAHQDKFFSVNNQGDFVKDELNYQTIKDISTTTITKVINNCGCPTKATSSIPNITASGTADTNTLLTYEKNGSYFMAKVTPNGNLINERYIDDGVIPNTILETSCGIHILAKKNDLYTYFYTYDKTNTNCKKKDPYCEIVLDDECRIDIECDCWPCDINNNLCEIIKSVALIENEIARLLNCESAKIKKGICIAKCTHELVELNNSLNKSIMSITMLEQILKEKLEVVLKIYEEKNCCQKYECNNIDCC